MCNPKTLRQISGEESKNNRRLETGTARRSTQLGQRSRCSRRGGSTKRTDPRSQMGRKPSKAPRREADVSVPRQGASRIFDLAPKAMRAAHADRRHPDAMDAPVLAVERAGSARRGADGPDPKPFPAGVARPPSGRGALSAAASRRTLYPHFHCTAAKLDSGSGAGPLHHPSDGPPPPMGEECRQRPPKPIPPPSVEGAGRARGRCPKPSRQIGLHRGSVHA